MGIEAERLRLEKGKIDIINSIQKKGVPIPSNPPKKINELFTFIDLINAPFSRIETKTFVPSSGMADYPISNAGVAFVAFIATNPAQANNNGDIKMAFYTKDDVGDVTFASEYSSISSTANYISSKGGNAYSGGKIIFPKPIFASSRLKAGIEYWIAVAYK